MLPSAGKIRRRLRRPLGCGNVSPAREADKGRGA